MELYLASASLIRGDFFPNIAALRAVVEPEKGQLKKRFKVHHCKTGKNRKAHQQVDLKCGTLQSRLIVTSAWI
jgi:hypothetical protein